MHTPSALICWRPLPNRKEGWVIMSTPQIHSGMVATVAEDNFSLSTTGDRSATMRGAKNVNVLASAMGRSMHAVKKHVTDA